MSLFCDKVLVSNRCISGLIKKSWTDSSGEANEVAEAYEVKEAAKVLRPGKSPSRTLKSCKILNSALV
jgi:hypothetical protein